jgi:hypothetical protein
MRTTLRIDDDLLRALKERARQEDVSISRLLNDALRRGLSAPPSPGRKKKFVQKTYNMGPPLIDLTKANAIAAALEDEEIIRKMSQGK